MLKTGRIHDVVGIHAGNKFRSGVADGQIGSAGGTEVAGVSEDFYPFIDFGELFKDCQGVVGGVVINSNQFPVFVGLSFDASQTSGQKPSRVVNGHDDGNEGLLG